MTLSYRVTAAIACDSKGERGCDDAERIETAIEAMSMPLIHVTTAAMWNAFSQRYST